MKNGIEFPFEIEEADVDSSLGDWSVGFVDANVLNEKAWFAPEFEEQLVDLSLPIMVFSGIDEEDPQMESFRRNGQLMDELAEEIHAYNSMKFISCTILQPDTRIFCSYEK